ncbi:hypothetical protein [Paenarthrobacter nicotinovorans]|uniref:hypothetical protein n=1 Tax=Paenarthrobacter nicotinovorans TaxID=29320 RepID=UPI0011A64A34|nr:hypothetical protein [Paenarthrobacter nicotinovorans]
MSTLTGPIRGSWSLAPTGLLTVNGAAVAVIGESLPDGSNTTRIRLAENSAAGPNRMAVVVKAAWDEPAEGTEEACAGPLDDFGRPNAGCTYITWEDHPEWDIG